MYEHEGQRLDFELPNVGVGGETVAASELAADGESLLLVLLGSHYCSQSRELVRTLCENHDAFRERATTVVPVLPDIAERASVWDRQYDLPFPMLADPATESEETDAFGVFEPLQRSVPELPAFVFCSRVDGELQVVSAETEADLDVPLVGSVLEFVDSHRATAATSGGPPADG